MRVATVSGDKAQICTVCHLYEGYTTSHCHFSFMQRHSKRSAQSAFANKCNVDRKFKKPRRSAPQTPTTFPARQNIATKRKLKSWVWSFPVVVLGRRLSWRAQRNTHAPPPALNRFQAPLCVRLSFCVFALFASAHGDFHPQRSPPFGREAFLPPTGPRGLK